PARAHRRFLKKARANPGTQRRTKGQAGPSSRAQGRDREKAGAAPGANRDAQTGSSLRGLMFLFALVLFLFFFVAAHSRVLFFVLTESKHLGRFLVFLFAETHDLGRIDVLETEHVGLFFQPEWLHKDPPHNLIDTWTVTAERSADRPARREQSAFRWSPRATVEQIDKSVRV